MAKPAMSNGYRGWGHDTYVSASRSKNLG